MQATSIKKCRLCKGDLPSVPIIQQRNMPSVAQLFPHLQEKALEMIVDIDVYKCEYCDHIQLLDDLIVPYYKNVIRSSVISKEMMEYRSNQFMNFAEKYKLKDKNYLEIGAGNGEYLNIMSRYINQSFGYENDDIAVKNCINSGLNVIQYFIDKENHTSHVYHSFGMFNFLEHIPNPVIFLKKIKSYLSIDSIGIIEVPNFSKMLSDGCYSDFSTEHLNYFTINTFIRCIIEAGYKIHKIESTWHDHIITAIISPENIDNLDNLNVSYLSAYDFISSIDFVTLGKSVVWGAGHQSLASIKLLGLDKYIDFIVDSSPNKQNKFAPAIGKKILSPSFITKESIDTVFVACSSYNSEVIKTLKKKYHSVKNIMAIDNGTIEIVKGAYAK